MFPCYQTKNIKVSELIVLFFSFKNFMKFQVSILIPNGILFFNYEENLNGWRNWFVKNSPLIEAFSRRMTVEQIHTSW